MSSPNDYNQSLIANQEVINLLDYVKQINKIKYQIDISFIDELLELITKDECCIHHNMLQKYGVLDTKNNTTGNIKQLLERNDFEENKD